jgi:hypothetical protein
VDCGVTAAVKRVSIVLLFAMIGQRLTGDLAPGYTTSVRKRSDEQGIDMSLALQYFQDRLNTFINKGNGSYLNSYHLLPLRWLGGKGGGRDQRSSGRS